MSNKRGSPTGHERVAAFLLSLDRAIAAKILKSLKPDVVVQVARAMLELDPKAGEESAVNDVYRQLALSVHGPKQGRACNSGELRAILNATFGDKKGGEVLNEIHERRRLDRPFLNVEAHPPGTIFRVLRRESDAVAALVLSHLPPEVSAKVIRRYEEEKALAIVKRMAVLSPPNRAVLRAMANDLDAALELAAEEPPEPDPSDRLRSIAELLNHTPPELEKVVIESIGSENAGMAAELREFMFTWEDIATIDKRAMQKILGTVDTKTLSVALKACSPAVEAKVLGNLSHRVREMVAEERELAGAVPMSEVLGARADIMKNIRAMMETGEFSPARAGEDLVA
ncbi:MAG: FliG C-terminal domain-containing protein [Planctomycetota bacterium]